MKNLSHRRYPFQRQHRHREQERMTCEVKAKVGETKCYEFLLACEVGSLVSGRRL